MFISDSHLFTSMLRPDREVSTGWSKMLFLLPFGRIVLRGNPLGLPLSGLFCSEYCVLLAVTSTTTSHFDRSETVHLLQARWRRTSKSLLFLFLALVCVCTVDVPLSRDGGNAEAWLCKTCMSCSVLIQ